MNLFHKSLTSIPNVGNIEKLYIYDNQIGKLENLPEGLTELSIYYNQIVTLENLPKSLKKLYISCNKIGKLENLSEKLTDLGIVNNQIGKLENLPKSLEKLYIDSNQIKDIENLSEGLTELYISYNRIDNVKNLPNSLKILWIGNNPFSPETIKAFNILGINIDDYIHKKDLDKLRKVFYLQKCIKRYYQRRFNAGAIINRWIYSIIWNPRRKMRIMVLKKYKESIEIIKDSLADRKG